MATFREPGASLPRRVLVLSNGVAEDMVGAALAQAWQQRCPSLVIAAAPLLGSGHAYEKAGIPVLAPGIQLPSGGFTRLGVRAFLADWQAGWGQATREYIRRLRQERVNRMPPGVVPPLAGWLCVGDVYLLAVGWWALRMPAWFVPTAKSEFIHGHSRAEIAWMRRRVRAVYARDVPTATALARAGLPARFLGNPLLDVGGAAQAATQRAEGRGRPPSDGWTVGLLPGTRQDWPENLQKLTQVAVACRQQMEQWKTLAVPPLTPPPPQLRFLVAAPGLTPGSAGDLAARAAIRCVPFSTLLARADVVVGLAGTAHEQAAGLGIPVVAFPAGRLQYTLRFARAQQRLLGLALLLCPWKPATVARAVCALLQDPVRRSWMAAVGRERMGSAGAVEQIAQALADELTGVTTVHPETTGGGMPPMPPDS
ncbi:MAG: hypothetical protein IMX01_05445 [Limnochordaceae bacterium]|nr:hypothetical protein [Limnochordaceae bacterium]